MSWPGSGDADIEDWLTLARGVPLPPAGFIAGHEIVAMMAEANPDAPAVRGGGFELSYGELVTWARRISARLTRAGLGRGDRVALMAEPSVAMVAAVPGITGAGAAYVPVDLAQPDVRLAALLADAQVAAVLATEGAAARASGLDVPLIPIPESPAAEPAGEPALSSFTGSAESGDPVYLIYTSGSTGEPKGVLVEHGHLAASMRARHLVHPGVSVFLLVSPLAFDSSVAGLWGTLEAGGCLVVPSSEQVRDSERLLRLIAEHGVTRMLCVPALYRALLDAADRLGGDLMRSLRLVILAGEALPESLVRRHFAAHKHAVGLVNEYGPTEATVWASYHRFSGPEQVTIGRPIPGGRLYVLDEDRHPVPPGGEGELYIGGPSVARGYFGRPQATAEVFLEDPFAGAPGGRMYRTGDIVRWTGAGTLEFLGRRDDQVKVRGHRVELGMVQAVVREVAGVNDAVVLHDVDGDRLIAFIEAAEGTDSWQLRRSAADQLPEAAVPSEIKVLSELPRTPNGKIDRNALRSALEQPRQPLALDYAVPGDDFAAAVAAAWAQVLGRKEIPLDVNFFDLGGHSLTMFSLRDALEVRCGVRLSVVDLFQSTTVAAQSELVRVLHARGEGEAPDEPTAGQRARASRMRRRARQEGAK